MQKLKLFLVIAGFFSAFALSAADKAGLEVYYFHYTARCMTCNAIEAQTKKAADAKGVSFTSVNMDEKEGEALAKKMKISGKTVLVKNGKKEANLTNEAFLYARSMPEKYQEVLNANMDKLSK